MFVYALYLKDIPNKLKIGFTVDCIERTKQIVNCNSPFDLLIKFIIYKGRYAHQYEKDIHSYLKGNRLEGEWFDDSEGRVSYFLRVCGFIDVKSKVDSGEWDDCSSFFKSYKFLNKFPLPDDYCDYHERMKKNMV